GLQHETGVNPAVFEIIDANAGYSLDLPERADHGQARLFRLVNRGLDPDHIDREHGDRIDAARHEIPDIVDLRRCVPFGIAHDDFDARSFGRLVHAGDD